MGRMVGHVDQTVSACSTYLVSRLYPRMPTPIAPTTVKHAAMPIDSYASMWHGSDAGPSIRAVSQSNMNARRWSGYRSAVQTAAVRGTACCLKTSVGNAQVLFVLNPTLVWSSMVRHTAGQRRRACWHFRRVVRASRRASESLIGGQKGRTLSVQRSPKDGGIHRSRV